MTSDRSLFPDQYPDKVRKPRAPRTTCCGHLEAPPHVQARTWQFLHDMAHGRVPFTLATLARLAKTDVDEARRAAVAAEREKWIVAIKPDPCFPGPKGTHWIGRLRRRAGA